MPNSGKRWTIQDRDGNLIYLTGERWQHIIDEVNHPEMIEHEDHLKTTIQKGDRRQEPLNPRKYRYIYPFDDLPEAAITSLPSFSSGSMSMRTAKQFQTTLWQLRFSSIYVQKA